jgi:hypothetical protein
LNAGVVTALRAARSQHHPATLYFGHWRERPPGSLLAEDVALAHALQAYEDDLCAGCGSPSRISYTSLGDGEFVVDQATTCRACTVLDTHRLQASKREPVPGRIVRLIGKWHQPKSEVKKKFVPRMFNRE